MVVLCIDLIFRFLCYYGCDRKLISVLYNIVPFIYKAISISLHFIYNIHVFIYSLRFFILLNCNIFHQAAMLLTMLYAFDQTFLCFLYQAIVFLTIQWCFRPKELCFLSYFGAF